MKVKAERYTETKRVAAANKETVRRCDGCISIKVLVKDCKRHQSLCDGHLTDHKHPLVRIPVNLQCPAGIDPAMSCVVSMLIIVIPEGSHTVKSQTPLTNMFVFLFDSGQCHYTWGGGVGGTMDRESALRSAGNLPSRVQSPAPMLCSVGGPESLRSPCYGQTIH
ncbi:hypothetical protein PoB_007343300 [Plakobranchus ocellatus]|uniref:Uncharacterized protein n=1 Tax=Plakobranchus ocellatus TaxID=259542 RepID=A0AAV4DS68_9GAST|nr:hypothetical protein PoB_007343300 [Plakobranchus ocellatus]